MKAEVNVLLTPSSSGMAIAAIKALRQESRMRIIATDVDKLAPGLYLSDSAHIVPPFSSRRFFPSLLRIAKQEKVDVVIPCLDTILLDFAKKRDMFEKIGTQVMVSNERTIEITRDKWKTYELLKAVVPLPRSSVKKEGMILRYPLIIKPRFGSGSAGVHRINSRQELDFFYRRTSYPIIQEYLPGIEYTVDCLADMSGRLVTVVPRQRIETRSGVSVKGKVVANNRLASMAERICGKLDLLGPFFFQAKEDRNGSPKLTEINARIGGGMCLSSFSGPNIHVMAVKLLLGEDVRVPATRVGLYMSRYWQEIYLTETEMKNRLKR